MNRADRILVLVSTTLSIILSVASAENSNTDVTKMMAFLNHFNHIVKEDSLIRYELKRHVTGRYFMVVPDTNTTSLTVMITPCSSNVSWSVYHKGDPGVGAAVNLIQIIDNYNNDDHEMYSATSDTTRVFSTSSGYRGLYIIQVTAMDRDTFIELFVSRYIDLKKMTLRLQQNPRIRLQRNKHKNKMTVRWKQSLIDPKEIQYCIVVNSVRDYACLCEVESGLLGSDPAQDNCLKDLNFMWSNHEGINDRYSHDDITIECFNKRLSFIAKHLEEGKTYFFNLFIIDRKKMLSVPYGNIKYNKKSHRMGLRDNKPVVINLRKFDGIALCHYKVSEIRDATSTLNYHLTPCGGAVDVEIRRNGSVVIPRSRIEGYKLLQVLDPKPGQRYVLKLLVTDPEEQISRVEVLATMKTTSLPLLPDELRVNEYISLRRCNSVTVGWIPAIDNQEEEMRYCVSATLIPTTTDKYLYYKPFK
uniref:Protein NDNF n=1 Tax=Clastoptera arizonana TaxID=38151 RepID=A0A1B6CPL2_9HEMI